VKIIYYKSLNIDSVMSAVLQLLWLSMTQERDSNPIEVICVEEAPAVPFVNPTLEAQPTYEMFTTEQVLRDQFDTVTSGVELDEESLTAEIVEHKSPTFALKSLAQIVNRYWNMEKLSQFQLLHLWANKNAMVDYLQTYAAGKLPKAYVVRAAETADYVASDYQRYVAVLRKQIERNFRKQWFGDNRQGIIMPVMSVSSEDSFDVIRQISWSYDNIVVYEDTKDGRHYRIYDKQGTLRHTSPWFESFFKPKEIWQEGKILNIITDLKVDSPRSLDLR
jgi:hypothetical protein